MTFEQLKASILGAARRFEMCDQYHDMNLAADYQEFISAGIQLLEYGWRTGIITAAHLAEFPAGILQDNGIYYGITGTVAAAPAIPLPYFEKYEVFIIGGSNVSISYDGDKKYKVNILDAAATLTIGEDCYVEVNTYRGSGVITCAGNCISKIEARNPDAAEILLVVEDNAQADVELESYTVLNGNVLDTAFVKINTHNNSAALFANAEDETFIVGKAFDQSTITYNSAV